MKNRAVDVVGADARVCECARPWAQRIVDGGAVDCLKCGREIEVTDVDRGLLGRADAVAAAALRSAGVPGT